MSDPTMPRRFSFGALLRSLRPHQWTKNLVVFAPLLFSEHGLLSRVDAWLLTATAFLAFSLVSGIVYLINDVIDRERDRLHPDKCRRPIASGRLSVRAAVVAMAAIGAVVGGLSLLLSRWFLAIAAGYLVVNLGYSLWLKNVVIVDVMTIGVGFVLRALAGVAALEPIAHGLGQRIAISPWLLLCTLLLALFLALSKRRQELARLGDEAAHTRGILAEYSLHFIDEMTAVVTASTVMAYALYTIAPETVQKFHTDQLILTVPFVLFGIFRYLYLIHIRSLGEKPAEVLLADLPLQINLVLWVVAVALILHLPRAAAP